MDVKINTAMKLCPVKTQSQCKFWEQSVIGVIVLLCTIAITGHFQDWNLFKQVFIGIIVSGCTIWCLWVIRAFYGIVTWWVKMHSQLDTITTLLAEAKADLKEIKSTL